MATYDKIADQYSETLQFLKSIPHHVLARLALDYATNLMIQEENHGGPVLHDPEMAIDVKEQLKFIEEEMALGPYKPRVPKKKMIVVDGKEFPLSKVIEVKVPRKLLFIEEMADGNLRLTVSSAFGIDVSELSLIEIVRKD